MALETTRTEDLQESWLLWLVPKTPTAERPEQHLVRYSEDSALKDAKTYAINGYTVYVYKVHSQFKMTDPALSVRTMPGPKDKAPTQKTEWGQINQQSWDQLTKQMSDAGLGYGGTSQNQKCWKCGGCKGSCACMWMTGGFRFPGDHKL